MKVAINAAIIKDKNILLVKKGHVWILPGGKSNDGESDLECLCREVSEELCGTQIKNIRKYGDFKGISPNKKEDVLAKIYFADIKGELRGPSAEISKAEFFAYEVCYYLYISNITSRVIESLRQQEYL